MSGRGDGVVSVLCSFPCYLVSKRSVVNYYDVGSFEYIV